MTTEIDADGALSSKIWDIVAQIEKITSEVLELQDFEANEDLQEALQDLLRAAGDFHRVSKR